MARKKYKVSGLKADGTPNTSWLKFIERLHNDNSTPNTWKAENALGYIIRKYREYAGIEFTFTYSGAPSKCQEIYCTKRMILKLGTEDGNIIKQYIDWIYDDAKNRKILIKTIAYFFTDGLIQKFKDNIRKSQKITRSTQIPSQFENIVGPLNVVTYGDLAFIKMAAESNQDPQYAELLINLQNAGFNTSILDNLEN